MQRAVRSSLIRPRDLVETDVQSDLNAAFAETLKRQRVVPVLTIGDPDSGVRLAEALAAGGLRLIEITMRTPAALETMRRLAAHPDLVVGAGTALTPAMAQEAIAAGAKFLVSPGATPALIDAGRDLPVPYLPGAATASEAMWLASRGYRVLKLFPAEQSGGVALLKALAAPLADIVFCPTGGIDAAKAPAYLALKNVVAVGGSWIAPDVLVKAGDWDAITRLAQAALDRPASAAVATPGNAAAAPGINAPPSPAETPPAAPPVESAEDGPSVFQRLRKLGDELEAFASDVAHANELADHAAFRKAAAILADPETPLDTVIDYACGSRWTLVCAALVALRERPDRAGAFDRITARCEEYSAWQMHFALELLAEADPPPVDRLLAGFRDWWADNTNVAHDLGRYFESLGDRAPDALGPLTRRLPAATQERIRTLLGRIDDPLATTLAKGLKGPPPGDPASGQRSVTETVGRFWSPNDQTHLVEPDPWREALALAATILDRKPLRSLLVSGDALVGKTSFLRLLAKRLAARGWRVYEASGADLQAGQQYIGMLEGRLRQLLDELTAGNRIVWYVPDLLQLALSGSHQAQSATILDQILPAMTDGQLVVVTEATPASVARLLQIRSSLRRVMEVVGLEPFDSAATLAIAAPLSKALAGDGRLTIETGFAAATVEAAAHYLGASTLPGSALSLIRLAATKAETGPRKLTPGLALDTLASLTGLPRSILDGSERLDLLALRNFFEARVIGQPEAVDSMVGRIAMLKAGLNDPLKPIGVFLFAGPTGTGKTEMAKALAEYLFGSADRMIRLDMSEYQGPDAMAKLVGGPSLPADADTLVSRIRKQPFSVLLLDELEKSSPYIWDFFLQLFDEGRLTDQNGRTADFRHTIIILTTNLGATQHRGSTLGFAPSRGEFANDQIMSVVGQTFRPEFQNRLDKVIVFQPLTRDLMRGILRKELERLFQRRGLKDRDWAIEWEAPALEFLLEKGFSPEMGARPLKRAIDQFVAAPLAQTIVERRFPEGEQFVFMRSDGKAIQAEFVDPDGDGEPFDPKAKPVPESAKGVPTLAGIVIGAAGTSAEIAVLDAAAQDIAGRLASAAWEAEKSRLSAAMSAPAFWTGADRFETLSRYALMDRIALAAETGQSLAARLERRRSGASHGSRELMGRLALQLHLVREGLLDHDELSPVEVALAVEPAFESGSDRKAATDWCDRILGMYRGWARRRNMQIGEMPAAKPLHGAALVISGFGAARRLRREAGLHVLEGLDTASGRVAARVLVVEAPLGDMPRARLAASIAAALAVEPRTGTAVRRYRQQPSPLVRNAEGTWRSGKLDAVLAGDFDLLAGE